MRVLASLASTLLALPRRALLKNAAGLAMLSTAGSMDFANAAEPPLPKTVGLMKFCDESVMSQKAHGTSVAPVQQDLRWNVDRGTAGTAPVLIVPEGCESCARRVGRQSDNLMQGCPSPRRSHLQLQSSLCGVCRILQNDQLPKGGQP
jgi:hypothetical protein